MAAGCSFREDKTGIWKFALQDGRVTATVMQSAGNLSQHSQLIQIGEKSAVYCMRRQ